MKLTINKTIFEQYPDVLLGVVVVHGIDNSGDNADLAPLLRIAEKEAVEKLGDTLITEQPFIVPWREAYRKFGAKPKDYPSSIENLLRRTLKGEQVRHINKLVDIYNVISLRYLIPVGGEDLSKIEGDVVLTIASDNEASIKLLGEPEARSPHSGEVIYKDNVGAICRRWNWKEADRTKLMEATKDAVLVVEALPPFGEKEVRAALDDLVNMIKTYCGGESISKILSQSDPEIELK